MEIGRKLKKVRERGKITAETEFREFSTGDLDIGKTSSIGAGNCNGLEADRGKENFFTSVLVHRKCGVVDYVANEDP